MLNVKPPFKLFCSNSNLSIIQDILKEKGYSWLSGFKGRFLSVDPDPNSGYYIILDKSKQKLSGENFYISYLFLSETEYYKRIACKEITVKDLLENKVAIKIEATYLK